jgi:hypothetical protein
LARACAPLGKVFSGLYSTKATRCEFHGIIGRMPLELSRIDVLVLDVATAPLKDGERYGLLQI